MIEDTIEQLRNLVAERLDVNIALADIAPDTPLLSGALGLDSMAIIELVTMTEQHFDVEFGEGELNIDSFASIRALANIVEVLRARSPQPAEG